VDPHILYRRVSRNLKRVAIMASSAALGVAAGASSLFAHTGQPPAPHDFWRAWTFEPAVILLLLASAGLYARGVARLWAASETGSGVQIWRVAAFAAGWVALLIALVSPLHALGSARFSAHMTQHEILISIAAPLLVLGRPVVPFLWAFPKESRRTLGVLARTPGVSRVWNVLTTPSVAFGVHAIALWAWHLPGLYQATLTNDLVHSLQHTSFMLTALLFWWTILGGKRGELARGRAILYLFLTALQTGALGALLTFSPSLWYPAYAATTAPWGLSPLDDQQLGGLIMWIPGSIAYLIAALALLAEWLRESERRSFHRLSLIATALPHQPD
jgi:putative membrane protein